LVVKMLPILELLESLEKNFERKNFIEDF